MARRCVQRSRVEVRAQQADFHLRVRNAMACAPGLYSVIGFERLRTGHLSEKAVGLGWAAAAPDEIEGAAGVGSEPGIWLGEGGDDEKEVAPLEAARGRKNDDALRLRDNQTTA